MNAPDTMKQVNWGGGVDVRWWLDGAGRSGAKPVWYYDTKGMARKDDDKG